MIEDLSKDVKRFLLTYTSIDQLIGLTQSELNRIYGLLEAELARQSWFSSTDFKTQRSWKWVQVWKKHWQPSVTQNCPWIHFEYTLSWPDQWVQASIDIESQKVVSWDAIQLVAEQLSQLLSEEKPKSINGQGWMLKYPLEAKRMLLVNRCKIDDSEFSGDWILNTGKDLFNQLSEVIPCVDRTIEKLFAI